MNYPSIEEYLDTVVKNAERDGYTTTVFGRRRYIPELGSQNGNMRAFGRRIAMNAPIQGAAADIMKMAMLKVYNRLKAENLDARIVMQVHDELVVEAKDEIVETVKTILREEMESAAELSIPLTVDVTSGKNWLEQA
jgi:DNA polymerase-1